MDIEKSVAALTALIVAVTGLVTALIPVLRIFKPSDDDKEATNNPASKSNLKRKTNTRRRSPPRFKKLTKSPAFLIGIGLLLVSSIIVGLLWLRATALSVEITYPFSDKPLDVKADSNGTAGSYAVNGNYTGDLTANNLKIYILVRSGNSRDEPWFIQEGEAIITKKDRWFEDGRWQFEEAYVGTGSGVETEKLHSGDVWEVQAILADENLPKFKMIPPDKLNQSLEPKAQSKLLRLKIGTID
jgi:hypothetical protein